MRNKDQKDWFVLLMKPWQILKVLDYLTNLLIHKYTNTKIKVRSWSDRNKKILICLLPLMVFVRLQEKKVNKVFAVSVVKRYLFVLGIRAVVFNHEVLYMKSYLENKFQILEKKQEEIGNFIKINFSSQYAEIIVVK